MQRQKRVFEISIVQIWLAVLIIALALTIVFKIGASVGRKRAIEMKPRFVRQSEMRSYIPGPLSNTTKLLSNSFSERMPGSPLKAMENEVQHVSSSNESETLGMKVRSPQYTIQVGVFSSSENAEGLVDLLKSHCYTSWLSFNPDAEGSVYRVFIGKFGTSDEADQFGKSLHEKEQYLTDYKVAKIQDWETGT